MVLRIVVGLDPSEYSNGAAALGAHLVKGAGGLLSGVTVVDVPGIVRAQAGSGVGAAAFAKAAEKFHLGHAEKASEKMAADFERTVAGFGVEFETSIERDNPAQALTVAGMAADLIAVGVRTHFHHETRDDDGDTLKDLLRHQQCPILVAPEKFVPPERCILMVDGTPAASRAMRLLGFLIDQKAVPNKVIMVHIGDASDESSLMLQAGETFFAAHGAEVSRLEVAGTPKAEVCAIAKEHGPCLAVLGGSTKNVLTKVIFGGVTKSLLADATIPMLVAP